MVNNEQAECIHSLLLKISMKPTPESCDSKFDLKKSKEVNHQIVKDQINKPTQKSTRVATLVDQLSEDSSSFFVMGR
jgi:hypothetical protein